MDITKKAPSTSPKGTEISCDSKTKTFELLVSYSENAFYLHLSLSFIQFKCGGGCTVHKGHMGECSKGVKECIWCVARTAFVYKCIPHHMIDKMKAHSYTEPSRHIGEQLNTHTHASHKLQHLHKFKTILLKIKR